ncbi:hypothetical protein RUM43_000371, partial [Polyplax serrata]
MDDGGRKELETDRVRLGDKIQGCGGELWVKCNIHKCIFIRINNEEESVPVSPWFTC